MSDIELKVRYDEPNDTLTVDISPSPNDGFMVEIGDGFILKLGVDDGDVIGYIIKEYSKNVHKNKIWSKKLTVPLENNYDGAFYGKMIKGGDASWATEKKL